MTTVKDRALAFLGVQPSETRSVALMTAHSFAMGCSTVLFETAASATFLSRFSATYLPWIYIAAAGVNMATGTVYANVQRRVSFARLMRGTLWFLLAMVLSVRTGFAVTDVAWVAFAGLVSYRVLSSLSDLEYWAVASRIYDVRQAKRLFGLIGTGEVVARIVGAFSVPLLVAIGGVDNLMLVAAGALALCVVLLGAVIRPIAGLDVVAPPPKPKDAAASRAGIREIAGNRYLRLVVGVAIMATFGKYFVDFAFLEEMSRLPKGEAQIATFIGVFNGVAQTLSLLTRLFVSRPLLHRFGIRAGVLVLPVAHAVCAAVTVAAGLAGADASVVFWLIIVNQGIYDTLKHPIDNASFKVLYQPLQAAQRLAAQIAVEVIFAPAVVGVAGGVMLLFSAGMAYDPVVFSGVLLADFVVWAGLARAAGGGYMRKLVDNLRARIEGNVVLPFDDATTLSVLRSRLASESPAEVCVALHLLEKAGAPNLVDMLVARAGHGAPEVRTYVLDRLIELQPSALRDMRARISRDPNASVRRAGAKAVAASAGVRAIDEMAPYLGDPDAVVRRSAVAALFDLGDAHATRAAIAAIESFAASTRADDRALAARLAGEHRQAAIARRLLDDPELAVRRAALHAAGLLADVPIDALVVRLDDPHLAQVAVTALGARGDAAIAALSPRLAPGAPRPLLRRAIEVHRVVGGPAAIAALRAHVSFPDATVRGRVLAALDALGYAIPQTSGAGLERAGVFALVTDEIREATWTLAAIRDLEGADDLTALRAALADDVAAAARRVFDLLGVIHDRVAVHRVAANIAHPAKDKRAYAHEVLDLMLAPEQRELVVPLLDDLPSAERLRRLAARFPQPALDRDARVRAIIDRGERWLAGFTRALAIRSSSDGTVTKDAAAMLLIEKVIMLKTVPMFAKADEELLAEIATLFEEVEHRAGETIVAKGDTGESMYLVVSGRVQVRDGDTVLSELGDKEIFGELALLDPQPRSASVVAVSDARLFRLDGETFSQLMAGNLEIVRGVLHVLCERLRKTSANAATA